MLFKEVEKKIGIEDSERGHNNVKNQIPNARK